MESKLARDPATCPTRYHAQYNCPPRREPPKEGVGVIEPVPHRSRSIQRSHAPVGAASISSLPVWRTRTDCSTHLEWVPWSPTTWQRGPHTPYPWDRNLVRTPEGRYLAAAASYARRRRTRKLYFFSWLITGIWKDHQDIRIYTWNSTWTLRCVFIIGLLKVLAAPWPLEGGRNAAVWLFGTCSVL